MEAVPRLHMLSFALKSSPTGTSFTNLKKFIAEFYQEDPELYSKEVHALETLRNQAMHPTKDSCSILKRYYCQLHSLQHRFPQILESGIFTFTWKDLYQSQVAEYTDLRYEMAAILFNIAASHTQIGSSVARGDVDAMKLACTHFQCAAWAFGELRQRFSNLSVGQIDFMTPALLVFMQQVSFAQAQECILEKSLIDNRKPNIVAKVTAQIVVYYGAALAALLTGGDDGPIAQVVENSVFKLWKKYVRFKISYLHCILYLYQGQHSEEQQKMGERVTLYQAAWDKLEEARKESKGLPDQKEIIEALTFAADVVEAKRKNAKNENEFIYHEAVPELSSISAVQGANLVNGIAFSVSDPEVAGEDIFSRLVPMKAHEASSMYSEEKAKLLRKYGALIEEKDTELTSFMSSLSLENLNINEEKANKIPQGIVDRCAALNANKNAIPDLISAMSQLAEICADVEMNLKEIGDILAEEISQEREFQKITGVKRTPNAHITELIREYQKYKEAHARAGESNDTLRKAMELHVNNLKILARPLQEIQKSVPKLSSELNTAEIFKDVKLILNKVNEMKAQRSQFHANLRIAVNEDDITSKVIAYGGSDEGLSELFGNELGKHERLTQLIDQNLLAQQNILHALTESYAKAAPVLKTLADVKHKRECFFSLLAASYDVYEDLLDKSAKGLEFYKKLSGNVQKLLTRLKSARDVQSEERQQRLKNATAPAAANKVPSAAGQHHGMASTGLMEANSNIPTIPASSSSATPKLRDYLKSKASGAGGIVVSSSAAPMGNIPAIRPNPLGSEAPSQAVCSSVVAPNEPPPPYSLQQTNYYDPCAAGYMNPMFQQNIAPPAYKLQASPNSQFQQVNTSMANLSLGREGDLSRNPPSISPTINYQYQQQSSLPLQQMQQFGNPANMNSMVSPGNLPTQQQPAGSLQQQNMLMQQQMHQQQAFPPHQQQQLQLSHGNTGVAYGLVSPASAYPQAQSFGGQQAQQQPLAPHTQMVNSFQGNAFNRPTLPQSNNVSSVLPTQPSLQAFANTNQQAAEVNTAQVSSQQQQHSYGAAGMPPAMSLNNQYPALDSHQSNNLPQSGNQSMQQTANIPSTQPLYIATSTFNSNTSASMGLPTGFAMGPAQSQNAAAASPHLQSQAYSQQQPQANSSQGFGANPLASSNALTSVPPTFQGPTTDNSVPSGRDSAPPGSIESAGSNGDARNQQGMHPGYSFNSHTGVYEYGSGYQQSAVTNPQFYGQYTSASAVNQGGHLVGTTDSESANKMNSATGFDSPIVSHTKGAASANAAASATSSAGASTSASNTQAGSDNANYYSIPYGYHSQGNAAQEQSQPQLAQPQSQQYQQQLSQPYPQPHQTQRPYEIPTMQQSTNYQRQPNNSVYMFSGSNLGAANTSTTISSSDCASSSEVQKNNNQSFGVGSQMGAAPPTTAAVSASTKAVALPVKKQSSNLDLLSDLEISDAGVPPPILPQPILKPQVAPSPPASQVANDSSVSEEPKNLVTHPAPVDTAQSPPSLPTHTQSQQQPPGSPIDSLAIGAHQRKQSLDNLSICSNLSSLDNSFDWDSVSMAATANEKHSSITGASTGSNKATSFLLKPFDSLNDDKTLKYFHKEVERYEKLIENLNVKMLNGHTQLSAKWKELQDLLAKDSSRHTTTIAKLFPEKNRSVDCLPYDHARVKLEKNTDDYINAAFIKNLGAGCPNLIIAQTPLSNTITDFWSMIWTQKARSVVSLHTQNEMLDPFWPQDLDGESHFDDFIVKCVKVNALSHCTEYKLKLSMHNADPIIDLSVLQIKSWTNNSPAQITGIAGNAVQVHQQRCLEFNAPASPIVVSCLTGSKRSELIAVAMCAILAIQSKRPTLINVVDVWYRICSQRQNALRDAAILEQSMQIILNHAHDMLNKRGIMTSYQMKIAPQTVNKEKEESKDPLNELDPLWKLK